VSDELARLLTIIGETRGSSGAIAVAAGPCAAHAYHAPTPTYFELHHVVPRSWQATWRPDVAPFPGHYDGQPLWDARTVDLCRTGHGDVHYWIVTLMHAWQEGDELGDLARRVRAAARNAVGKTEFVIAQQALGRFSGVGGDLGALAAAHEYGAI
jgi:hypothetical protein